MGLTIGLPKSKSTIILGIFGVIMTVAMTVMLVPLYFEARENESDGILTYNIDTYNVNDIENIENYKTIIRNSFESWESINPKLNYVEIEDRYNSEIQIIWNNDIESGGLTQLQNTYSPIIQLNFNNYGCKLTNSDIGYIVKHEIGHTLGINHNPNNDHLMYGVNNDGTLYNSLDYNIPNSSWRGC